MSGKTSAGEESRQEALPVVRVRWGWGARGGYSATMFPFQLILGIPEQALSLLHMAIEPILADGAVLDKGRAMFLVAKCQVASAASYDPLKKAEGREPYQDC